MLTNQYYNPVPFQQFAYDKMSAYATPEELGDFDQPGMLAGTNPAVPKVGSNIDPTKITQGVQLGGQLASMATSLLPVEENPYKLDQFAGLRGMGQGAQAGSAFGPLGTAIGAGVGLIAGGVAGVLKNRKALKNVDTDVNATAMSATGQPVYLGGNINKAMSELNDINASSRGAVFNRKLRRNAQNRLGGAIQTAQTDFNESSQAFNQDQIAREQYRQRRDMTNRMYNLYA